MALIKSGAADTQSEYTAALSEQNEQHKFAGVSDSLLDLHVTVSTAEEQTMRRTHTSQGYNVH